LLPTIPWPQLRYDFGQVHRITDGSGVTVGVIDSGVDEQAPQLARAVERGADMLDSGGDGRQDCVGHGIAVASIIAGAPEAGVGLQGLAPGVRILPVRVSERVENGSDTTGSGTVSDLAAGIRAAVAARPRPAVINLSISTADNDPELHAAINSALDADVVVMAAVGNDNDHGDPTPYPAAYHGVVGVGAIGPDGLRVSSSQVGPYVDLTAPGFAVIGDAPGNGQQTFEGTSFAAPFVAATAALIRARVPQMHRQDVVARLLATADPAVGAAPSTGYGYRVPNPLRALTAVVDPSTSAGGAVSSSPSPQSTPVPPSPTAVLDPLVVGFALALVLGATVLCVIAVAVPAGRRRRCQPGQVPTLLGPPPDQRASAAPMVAAKPPVLAPRRRGARRST
jgi:type VII secretion-associated serine protease mycosin